MSRNARRNSAPSNSTRLSLEMLESRDVPAWFAIQINGPGAGSDGQTASTYASGTLHTNAEYEMEEPGLAILEAPTAGEAILEALTGSIQMFVPPPTQVGYAEQTFPFTPETVGFAIPEHKPYLLRLLQPATGGGGEEGPPTSPPPPSNIWVLNLEDLSPYPSYCDWDYNDRSWIIQAVNLESMSGGGDDSVPGGTSGTFIFENTPANPANQAGYSPKEFLRVSKWPNAFTVNADKTVSARPLDDWIYGDEDDFTVRFTQTEAERTQNNNPNSRDILTADMWVHRETRQMGGEIVDPKRTITLEETGNQTGVFRSRSFILVSNSNDDNWDVTAGTHCQIDNTADDPTLLAALGDCVRVQFPNSNVANSGAFGLVKPLASIKLRFYLLKKTHIGITTNDPPYATVQEVEDQYQAIREIYAQLGIWVYRTKNIADSIEGEPQWQDQNNETQKFDGEAPFDVSATTQREHDLFDRLRDSKAGLIHVYYLNELSLPGEDPPAGRAYSDWATDPASVAFMDSVVIERNDNGSTSRNTLAHEVGHILGLPHVPATTGVRADPFHPALSDTDRKTHQTNVMAPGPFNNQDSPYAESGTGSIYDQKRLDIVQEHSINTHQRPPGKPKLLSKY